VKGPAEVVERIDLVVNGGPEHRPVQLGGGVAAEDHLVVGVVEGHLLH